MSRISLGGGKSISIRDYAIGLGRTGNAAGAIRYAQGKDDLRKRDEKLRQERAQQLETARQSAQSRVDNVGGSR